MLGDGQKQLPDLDFAPLPKTLQDKAIAAARQDPVTDPCRSPRQARSIADTAFRWLAIGAAALVLLILGADRGHDDASRAGRCSATWASTSSRRRRGPSTTSIFGALPFIWGTVYTAAIAVVIAVPVSLGVALFVTQIAPRS